ncbi:MAG TPA: uroporphyrinogen decarboxylase [Natrialbaceae archaeon]|nr:uroporphyrinogen decarboxylase [Natrialbaceae archaeon]
MRDRFLRAARGERTDRPPVWLMRQAGRYLPEYHEIREEYSFLEAIKTPDVAEEITLQPYERFGVDGVVMYSDILTVLEPLGFDYHIESGVGPVIENPIEGPDDVPEPGSHEPVEEAIDYVGALLERLTGRLGDEAAVIGFAGGPFTLASYVLEGGSSRNYMTTRRFRVEHPDAFQRLVQAFADVVADYLAYQERAGADVVQLFDTYAGVLPPEEYRDVLLPRHREIFDAVEVPTIVFVRNVSGNLDLLVDTGADVVGLDWTVDMATAREELGDTPVQGNLDPAHLFGGPEHVRERTREVIEKAGPEGHVLNLGHGVNKDTPVEGVETFVETAKSVER